MSQEQKESIFPSLNTLLFLSKDGWEDELSQEQFYALVLSYNDLILGSRRDKKNGLYGRVYDLEDRELGVLEQAYKSGKNASFDEQNIRKNLARVCGKDVGELVLSDMDRHALRENLHRLAVSKLTQNSRVDQFFVYRKANDILQNENYKYVRENYTALCSMNKTIDEKFSSDVQSENKARRLVFEGMFSHIYDSVKASICFDAYQKLSQSSEAV